MYEPSHVALHTVLPVGTDAGPEDPAAEVRYRMSEIPVSAIAPLKRRREEDEDLAAYRRVRLRVMDFCMLGRSGQPRRWRIWVQHLRSSGWYNLGVGYGLFSEDEVC